MKSTSLLVLFLAAPLLRGAENEKVILEAKNGLVRVSVVQSGKRFDETVAIKEGGEWISALQVEAPATRVVAGTPGKLQECEVKSIVGLQNPDRIVIRSTCGVGTLEQSLMLSSEPDVIRVRASFSPDGEAKIRSVEDRYYFAPGRRETDNLVQGPVDFVWSQNLKSAPDDLIPQWGFKSPAVMLQQDSVLVALMPAFGVQAGVPVALDLDVTSEAKPWLSYGCVPSESHGHSYFRRGANASIASASGTIEYSYEMVASSQQPRLGYRRIVRRLWQEWGRPQLSKSPDLQQNVKRRDLATFDEWRQEAWVRYANEVYRAVGCPVGACGTLASDRNYLGDWNKPQEDAWFNAWFQSLRTAYGWYLYGRRTNNSKIQRKAESILTLALQSPRRGGAFPTIYLVPEHRWIRDDGWAGFAEDYHAFCMSWTAYWMLKWAEDLTPDRKNEVLVFTRAYGDFLLKHQLRSGVIPSWYDGDLNPRSEFRNLNAETAGSAVFLLELGALTQDPKYLQAGTRAMEFITREVLPRELWWDFETFKSCARKPFDFYDRITAQYPQNNLSTMQAAMAYLQLYRLSGQPRWLNLGEQVLDYLLLTQQVWNPPWFDPKLVGGFTTQNTDAEWSDARQGYAAVLLWDYYQVTGEIEYLDRAVGAVRASFAVAPWENWAHSGDNNEDGAMTGFHWGTGSAMTSVEIMSPTLGDVFIDLARKQGVGVNATSLQELRIVGNSISLEVQALPRMQSLRVEFSGADPRAEYQLICNGARAVTVRGDVLKEKGYTLDLAKK